MTATGVLLRPISAEDMPFLYLVFASTRTQELAPLGWSAAQQAAFLGRQFDAQHQSYQASFPDADFHVIVVNDRPAGRMYVARTPAEIWLLDIALLPQYRRAGIGSDLVGALLDEAAETCQPVRLHVEKHNPAVRLFERLGFRSVEVHGIYRFMEWLTASG